MKGIVICVNYDDLLCISLPRNARHLSEVVVVSTPEDEKTAEVVAGVANARLVTTDAFTRHGAKFNKGLAMEEGLDALGRDGWILIWDADIVLPEELSLPPLYAGYLYGARRRMLSDGRLFRDGLNWKALPVCPDRVIAGYFQLFNAEDPALAGCLSWYDVTFTHAGGGDGAFQAKWSYDHKVWTKTEVLHIGPRDTNWFGRCSARLDGEPAPDDGKQMLAYLSSKGWHGHGHPGAPKVPENVEVPGHHSTGYRLKGRFD